MTNILGKMCNEEGLKHYKENNRVQSGKRERSQMSFCDFHQNLMCGPPKIQLYLNLLIILPATLIDVGAIAIPGGLGVHLIIDPIIAPALLTTSRLRFIPTRMSVALCVDCVRIPAPSGLFWVLVIIVLGFLLCSGLFVLQGWGLRSIAMGLEARGSTGERMERRCKVQSRSH